MGFLLLLLLFYLILVPSVWHHFKCSSSVKFCYFHGLILVFQTTLFFEHFKTKFVSFFFFNFLFLFPFWFFLWSWTIFLITCEAVSRAIHHPPRPKDSPDPTGGLVGRRLPAPRPDAVVLSGSLAIWEIDEPNPPEDLFLPCQKLRVLAKNLVSPTLTLPIEGNLSQISTNLVRSRPNLDRFKQILARSHKIRPYLMRSSQITAKILQTQNRYTPETNTIWFGRFG